MNERIRELAVQSGMSKLVDSWEYERFAELIIRECVNNIKEWCDASDEHTDKEEYWQGYQHGCDDSAASIMEHFGVDE